MQANTLIYAMEDQADDTFVLSGEDRENYETVKTNSTVTSCSTVTLSSSGRGSTAGGKKKESQ